jgi:phage terminase large subunit
VCVGGCQAECLVPPLCLWHGRLVASDEVLDLSADGYVPLPAQERFHRSEAKFRLYSGGFGSGKSLCGCREAIYTALKFPGSFGMVGRLRFKDLENTTQRTFWQQLDSMGLRRKPYLVDFNQRTQIAKFGNGSEILFTGLDDEMKLRSAEYSWMYVDEGSEVPDDIYRTLLGRLRFKKPLQLWVTTNPGASGWIRRNFVQQSRQGFEWFHAPTTENHHLPKDYLDSLLADYPAVWRERYIQGSWSAFEGQVFTAADENIHLIDDWSPTPEHLIYEGWDFGYRNPTAVVWYAVHPNGEEPIVVFAEHEAREQMPPWHVHQIKAIYNHFKLNPAQIYRFGDPAGAQVQGLRGRSYVEEYSDLGLHGIQPSTKEPSTRALRIGKLLSTRIATKDGSVPAIQFCRRTRRTWDSLLSYRYAQSRSQTGEDPKEAFHKENDHLVDALGYALMAAPLPELEERRELPPGIVKPITAEDLDREAEGRYEQGANQNWLLGVDQ